MEFPQIATLTFYQNPTAEDYLQFYETSMVELFTNAIVFIS